ncbi:hypothetical protein [Pikeienuella sp. HZG-20]|uniref:hypothetical protein n=1 Tax=Paludibacillus litoralis TaxID=3133267 RepID=UPI0030ED5717
MSFVRPEVARAARRWRETALWVALTVIGAVWLTSSGGLAGWGLALCWGAAGLWLARSAFLSALAAGRAPAPGVVTIDERRISYFGPYEGGVVALDDIGRIGCGRVGGGPDAVWRLWSIETGDEVTIPVAADGAEALIDAFAALPEFAPARALSALNASSGVVTIWRRRRGGTLPTLAAGAAAD